MPLRKDDKDAARHNVGNDGVENSMGKKFPPEAYAYDSDITDAGIKRVELEAEKILSQEKWTIIDGVKER
jgi:hypothetical protein